MPELRRELPITRVALLELRDEQRLVQEGYQLLDEKRILLAGEIRRELERLHLRRAEMRAAEEVARTAVAVALARHGLDALSVHSPASLVDAHLAIAFSRFLGLQLPEARLLAPQAPLPVPPQPAVNSAEIGDCIRAYRALLERALAFAASAVRLRRLVREFVRTERRTRAIENVLVPELDTSMRFLEEQLDGMDQEELARARRSRAATLGLATARPTGESA